MKPIEDYVKNNSKKYFILLSKKSPWQKKKKKTTTTRGFILLGTKVGIGVEPQSLAKYHS